MLRATLRRAHAGWQEIVALTLLYGLYEVVRGLRTDHLAAARDHAQQLIRLEQSLGIYSERAVQQLAERIPLLVHALAILYPALHAAGTIGVLVWLYRARTPAFPLVRTALVLVTAFALVVYLLYPVAPPRLAMAGFVDTVSEHGPFDLSSSLLDRFYNPVAAVPSLHLAYAAVVGGAIAWQAHAFGVRLAGILYPFVALFVIVATGNHFYFDAATGAAVAFLATIASWLLTHGTPSSRRETVRRAGATQAVSSSASRSASAPTT